MQKTKIEGCDYAWPILNGCRRASEGCRNCYAEQLTATRLRQQPKYRGLAVYTEGGPRWTGQTRLWRPQLTAPLKLRRPSRIFVCDMGDLFYEGNTDEEIDEVFGVMWACLYLGSDGYPGHTFQVLTKRAARMRDYLSQDRRQQWASAGAPMCEGGDVIFDQIRHYRGPHPRIWFGVSGEDQANADARWAELAQIDAAVRFISMEPLLGPITMRGWATLPDWVITGGESGRSGRPMDVAWMRDIAAECADRRVACFSKQLGAHPYEWTTPPLTRGMVRQPLTLKHRKGADPREWPGGPEAWPRDFPQVRP